MNDTRTAVEVVAASWLLAAGYFLGRYRPVERAREWAIDEMVFRNKTTTPARALLALAIVMAVDPLRNRDIWLNILTLGRRPLPEPAKLAPAPRVLTPEERAARQHARDEEETLRRLDPDGDR